MNILYCLLWGRIGYPMGKYILPIYILETMLSRFHRQHFALDMATNPAPVRPGRLCPKFNGEKSI